MGIAMQNSGTALYLAQKILELVGDWGTLAVLMGIFLMTALSTVVMSNAAATVLVTPIAIDAARSLDANPQTFVMAVVIAAATSFLMPIGLQANVLVFDPGGKIRRLHQSGSMAVYYNSYCRIDLSAAHLASLR